MESGHCSDSEGYYSIFGHADNALRVRKGFPVHEVAFSYDYIEDNLEAGLIVRARRMIRRFRQVVVYDNGVDVYNLSTLNPRYLDTGTSWDDVYADTHVHVTLASTCAQEIERVRLSHNERKSLNGEYSER